MEDKIVNSIVCKQNESEIRKNFEEWYNKMYKGVNKVSVKICGHTYPLSDLLYDAYYEGCKF